MVAWLNLLGGTASAAAMSTTTPTGLGLGGGVPQHPRLPAPHDGARQLAQHSEPPQPLPAAAAARWRAQCLCLRALLGSDLPATDYRFKKSNKMKTD